MILNDIKQPSAKSSLQSRYYDFGVLASSYTAQQRCDLAERVIDRFFVTTENIQLYEHEFIARFVCPGGDFHQRYDEELELCEGGFAQRFEAPSQLVENAFRDYAQTELGAVALARLLRWDDQFVERGWRKHNGLLSEKGIMAYGAGLWRPFRVASHGAEADTVTTSGMMMLPDDFRQDRYSTGDIAHPFAIIHHELKAHVLPMLEAAGLQPGHKMQLICLNLESEALNEIDLPGRSLHWGKDGGTRNQTLALENEHYYRGLVQFDSQGEMQEIDPCTKQVKGPALSIG